VEVLEAQMDWVARAAFNYAYAQKGDWDLAEDVTSTVLIAIWQYVTRHRRGVNESFIRTKVEWAIKDALKKRRSQLPLVRDRSRDHGVSDEAAELYETDGSDQLGRSLTLRTPLAQDRPDKLVEEEHFVTVIRDALNNPASDDDEKGLTELEQQVVFDHYEEGLSPKQIAAKYPYFRGREKSIHSFLQAVYHKLRVKLKRAGHRSPDPSWEPYRFDPDRKARTKPRADK
jgi:DNA-directed RNA polymerase specialized sigma24 family protein